MVLWKICDLHLVNTHVCVYVCVGVCVLPFLKVVCKVAEILKNSPIWIRTFLVEWRKSVFLLLDLDLHFQGKRFGIFPNLRTSRKRLKIEQTPPVPSDRKSVVCPRTATLRLLYVMTFTYIFKVTNMEM